MGLDGERGREDGHEEEVADERGGNNWGKECR